jgi:hypothetical protein
MGRQPGSTNSPEHNDRISEAIRHRYQDDPDYQLMLSAKARERWKREADAEIRAQLDEFEANREHRQIIIGLRYLNRIVQERQLEADERRFKNAVREVLSGDFISRLSEGD